MAVKKIIVSLSPFNFYGSTNFIVDFGNTTEKVETSTHAIAEAMNVSKPLNGKYCEGDLDFKMTPAVYKKFIAVINSKK